MRTATSHRRLPDPTSCKSDKLSSLNAARAKLEPTDDDTLMKALMACLSLVKPVGMTMDDVGAWLSVAMDTLKHLPATVIGSGATAAQRTCTHHGQIVPMIIKESEASMHWLRRDLDREMDDLGLSRALPKPDAGEWRPTPEELEAIKVKVAASFPSARRSSSDHGDNAAKGS